MIAHPMTLDCAVEIHGRLVEAWMVREGLRPGPAPSLQGLRLADAQEAAAAIAGGEGRLAPRLCLPELSRLFAWTVVQSQMS